MRKRIKFDDKQIEEIREMASKEGCTIGDIANRYNISKDTVRRILWENQIVVNNRNIKIKAFEVSQEKENYACKLFADTDTAINDICKEVKIEWYQLKDILDKHFTKEFQESRTARLLRNSKLGEKNPMSGKFGDKHHNYKGQVGDGNGYLMQLKPDWYTGRKGSKHVFVHSVVMCEALGITEIPKGFTVHHIDGNKTNNSIDNLALITNSGHSKLHMIQRRLCKVQRLSSCGVEKSKDESIETPDTD